MPRPPAPGVTLAAQKLLRWRKNGGYTAFQASALLGTTRRALYRYETGQRSIPDVVRREMVDRRVCSADDFLTAPMPVQCAVCAGLPVRHDSQISCARGDFPRRSCLRQLAAA